MPYRPPRTIVASSARGASGNSGAMSVDQLGSVVALLINVTAQSGTTPTVLFTVEWSHDGSVFAVVDTTADSFASIGAVTPTVTKSFTLRAPFYRVVWTIAGGTPSYTFSVSEYIPA